MVRVFGGTLLVLVAAFSGALTGVVTFVSRFLPTRYEVTEHPVQRCPRPMMAFDRSCKGVDIAHGEPFSISLPREHSLNSNARCVRNTGSRLTPRIPVQGSFAGGRTSRSWRS